MGRPPIFEDYGHVRKRRRKREIYRTEVQPLTEEQRTLRYPFMNTKLRDARIAKRMNKRQVARAVGCHPSSMWLYENHACIPGSAIQQKLCRLFDLSPGELGFCLERRA